MDLTRRRIIQKESQQHKTRFVKICNKDTKHVN